MEVRIIIKLFNLPMLLLYIILLQWSGHRSASVSFIYVQEEINIQKMTVYLSRRLAWLPRPRSRGQTPRCDSLLRVVEFSKFNKSFQVICRGSQIFNCLALVLTSIISEGQTSLSGSL